MSYEDNYDQTARWDAESVREAEQCFDGAGLRRLVVGEQPAVRRMLEDALAHQLAYILLRAGAALHAAHADGNVLFHKRSPFLFSHSACFCYGILTQSVLSSWKLKSASQEAQHENRIDGKAIPPSS
jgi:hypothetical protein